MTRRRHLVRRGPRRALAVAFAIAGLGSAGLAQERAPDHVVDIGAEGDEEFVGEGFYGREGPNERSRMPIAQKNDFRWATNVFRLQIPIVPGKYNEITFHMHFSGCALPARPAPTTEEHEMASPAVRPWQLIGPPHLGAALPRRLRIAACLVAPGVYILTGLLMLAIIRKHLDEWRELIWIEGTPFVWLSCSLLLTAALLSGLNAMLGLFQSGPSRASTVTILAWFACAGALCLANVDERFILHEYHPDVGFRGEGWEVAAHPLLLVYLALAIGFGVVLFRRHRPSLAVKVTFVLGVLCSLRGQGRGRGPIRSWRPYRHYLLSPRTPARRDCIA